MKPLISTLFFMCFFLLQLSAQMSGTFKDKRDGHVYKWVLIGNDTWMAENLAFKAEYGCWACKDDPKLVKKYGYLYSWQTANEVCPEGWHLSSNSEWIELELKYGGRMNAAGKLKEIGTENWKEPNAGATNETGFTALPGGYIKGDPKDCGIGIAGLWWTSDEYNSERALFHFMYFSNPNLDQGTEDKWKGLSVRCVKN